MNKNAAAAKKIGRLAWKIIRWPLFVAIAIAITLATAWWSMIGTLYNESLQVPELRDKTMDEAKFLLTSRGLKYVVSESEKHSQEIDFGLILETDPPANAGIKRNRTVEITLSSGFEKDLIPDLLDGSVREAQLLGQQSNFTVKELNRIY